MGARVSEKPTTHADPADPDQHQGALVKDDARPTSAPAKESEPPSGNGNGNAKETKGAEKERGAARGTRPSRRKGPAAPVQSKIGPLIHADRYAKQRVAEQRRAAALAVLMGGKEGRGEGEGEARGACFFL